MRLLGLNLENFRNLKTANLSFSGDRIFFIGPNGQGKTNLLEAIGLSSNLRSFRKSGMDGLVRENAERSQLFFRFCEDDGEEHEVLLSFRSKAEKVLQVDGEKIKRFGDYLGKFPAVTLSSRDFRLIREGPSDRRKWLDLLLSSSSRQYFENLQTFHRALRGRNALLKKGSGESELLAFEHILSEATVPLQAARKNSIPMLADSLEKHYSFLCGGTEKASLRYHPDWPEMTSEEILNRLAEDRERDRIMGMTRRGPHRDDFVFLLEDRDARNYSSEGQQRGLVLAIRLAEYFYLKDSLRRIPLLLADDVLGELDQERKANFRKLLPPQAQVFATGTEFPSKDEVDMWETFRVSDGTFTKAEGTRNG